jgi:hypothetical protein
MPLFFGLFQACTKDRHFPITPNSRALPPLGGGNSKTTANHGGKLLT